MKIELGFGKSTQSLEISDKISVNVINPLELPKTGKTVTEIIEDAINNPIGTRKLEEIIKSGEKIAIITSDITRPLPSYLILPPLLKKLESFGVKMEDITIVFALGSHRKHTEEEKKKLLGDSYGRVNVADGTEKGIMHLGVTKHGTPVDICKIVAEADRRICLGNIEYHYFAGYSGGAKAIMPGVSTREAIQNNHSLMTHELAVAGNLETNPLRQDLEEAIEYCHIDFIINVILSEKKEIVHAVAGHFVKAHREGSRYLDSLYRVEIPSKADIVVVSQGGAPKDLNLYQTQKALDNAKHAVKNGGIVILVGECGEGFGEDVFEDWILSAEKPNDLIQRIQKDFQLGGHKAAAIAIVQNMADIYLVSKFPDDTVKKMHMKPFINVQEAFDSALEAKNNPNVIVMPYGGSTLPRLVD